MKRRFLVAVVRSGLSSILLGYAAFAQGGESDFAQWAAAHAVPVAKVESAGSDADLLPLESAIGAARVVALGEPMHGAHEPLALRNRLFRFLVERMGFTAIALESGFTESISARSFIERGEGDAGTAVRTGLSSWATRYRENLELIQWMHEYNAAASSAGRRKIHLYGIDMTTGGRKNGPWVSIDSALTFLSRADPTSAQEIRQSLGDRLSEIDAHEFGSLPADTQAEFDASINAVAHGMRKGRKNLIAGSSDDEYRWALHNLEAARQLSRCLPITPPPSASLNLWARAMTCRDSEMAENVRWALENEGRQGRLLVFAHNGHVMSAIEDGRRMADVRDKPPMMGFHVRRAYGKDLYIIALVCSTTSEGLPAAKPLEEGSIESTLAGVGLPLMFLDVRTAQQSKEARTWLSTRRSVNANVSSQALITLSTAVDAFFFVNTLTPAIVSSDEAH